MGHRKSKEVTKTVVVEKAVLPAGVSCADCDFGGASGAKTSFGKDGKEKLMSLN